MAVLRKAHSHSVVQIDKEINNVNKGPRRKSDLNMIDNNAFGFNKCNFGIN